MLSNLVRMSACVAVGLGVSAASIPEQLDRTASDARVKTRTINGADRFSVTLKGSGFVQLLPTFRLAGYRLSPTGADLTGVQRPVLVGAAEEIEATYYLGEAHAPVGLGRNTRVIVSAIRAGARGQVNTREFSPAGTLLHGNSVDGRVGLYFRSFPSVRLRHWYYRQRRAEFSVRLATDMASEGDLRFVPSLHLFGGWSRELYQHRGQTVEVQGTAFSGAPYHLDQRNSSIRLGSGAGLEVDIPIGQNWELALAGSASVYWINTKLRSSDCTRPGSGPDCNVAQGTFVTNFQFATSSSDSDSAIGVRTTLRLGLLWHQSWGSLGVSGYFRWESAVPGIENPASPTDAPVGTFVGASHIKYDPAWSAGAMIGVKIALN